MSYIKLTKQEFEAKLVQEFPKLYADMHGKPSQTCMAWGIATGPGWYDFIYELSSQLEQLIIKLPKDSEEHCRAAQVKEKFGGLRFYMTTQTDEMSKLIDEAEKKSYAICETCGEPGKCISSSWIYAACEKHTKEADKKALEDKTDTSNTD